MEAVKKPKATKIKEPKPVDPLVREIYGLFELFFRHHNGYSKPIQPVEAKAAKDLASKARCIAAQKIPTRMVSYVSISTNDDKIKYPTHTDGIYEIKQEGLMIDINDNYAFAIIAFVMDNIFVVFNGRRKYEIHKFNYNFYEYIKEIKDYYEHHSVTRKPNTDGFYI